MRPRPPAVVYETAEAFIARAVAFERTDKFYAGRCA